MFLMLFTQSFQNTLSYGEGGNDVIITMLLYKNFKASSCASGVSVSPFWNLGRYDFLLHVG